jgi:hypothetical protein
MTIKAKKTTKAAQASKSAKDKSKAAQASKSAKESITVWLGPDLEPLHAEAEKAGTTPPNIARILIRDGLAKLASGEYKITSPLAVPFNLLDEDGNVFERGQMPPELYDRACRAAEDQGTTVTALFESAIKKAAEALPA